MAIFSGPKIFKSGSADRAHRVFHFEVSYAPLAQCIRPGSQSEQIRLTSSAHTISAL